MRVLLLLLLYSSNASSSKSFFDNIKIFLDRDPQLQEQKNLTDFQNLQLEQAKSELLFPSLGVSSALTRSKSNFDSSESKFQNTSLNLSYSLFNFGSDYAGFKAAKLNKNKFESHLLHTKIEREKEILASMLDYISSSKKVLILSDIYGLKKKLYKLSNNRFKKGTLSSVDLLKVEIDMVNAESEYLLAKQQVLTTQDTLTSYSELSKLDLVEFPLTRQLLKQGIKEHFLRPFDVEKNPKLKSLKLAMTSFKHEVVKEQRLHFGQFSLEYTRSLYHSEESSDLYGHSTSIVYTLPLFEKYSRKKNIAQINAKAISSKIFYDFEKKFLLSNIKSSREKVQISLQNFRNRQKILSSSKKLFKSSSTQFRQGKLSVNELLIEQNRLLTTKLLSNSTVHDLHIHYFDLIHKYGRLVSEEFYK